MLSASRCTTTRSSFLLYVSLKIHAFVVLQRLHVTRLVRNCALCMEPLAQKILVVGGNGFIGKSLFVALFR